MICYIRDKKYGVTIELEKIPQNFTTILKEHLKKYNIVAIEPEVIGEIKWSDPIRLDMMFKTTPSELKSSGVYKIYMDDKLIYIGSSDSYGRLRGKRAGMWGRRADFKSSLKGDKRQTYMDIPNLLSKYFYNGKKFPMKDICRFSHRFFSCHPDLVRDIEYKVQKEYKDEHGDLPLLNRVENYVGGARKIK